MDRRWLWRCCWSKWWTHDTRGCTGNWTKDWRIATRSLRVKSAQDRCSASQMSILLGFRRWWQSDWFRNQNVRKAARCQASDVDHYAMGRSQDSDDMVGQTSRHRRQEGTSWLCLEARRAREMMTVFVVTTAVAGATFGHTPQSAPGQLISSHERVVLKMWRPHFAAVHHIGRALYGIHS